MCDVHVSNDKIWDQIVKLTDDKYSEGFFVCNLSDVVMKIENWKTLMPRVKPFYAVKCNPEPNLLKVIAAYGLGFDCASQQEIAQVLAMGVSPTRIIFANPTKIPTHLTYAVQSKVTLMTFDNAFELQKIKLHAPEARLLIRIRHDDSSAKYKLGEKFGCEVDTEAKDLLRQAKDLQLNVVGVAFHIGCCVKNPKTYREAIKAAASVFDMAQILGFDPHILDIGGGFNGELFTDLDEVYEIINQALDEYFLESMGVEVYSEPGRYFASSAFTLATKVHSKKCDPRGVFHYYTDVGVYNGLIPALPCFKETYRPIALKKGKDCDSPPRKQAKSASGISKVWGPTCDSFDLVIEKAELPELNMGDWIVMENSGAYTLCLSSSFNGLTTPKVHSVICTEDWALLKEKLQN